MARDYRGYTIGTGFLVGNLTDACSSASLAGVDHDASAAAYSGLLARALEQAYPGADVLITHEHGSGTVPFACQTYVETADGDQDDDEIATVRDIASRVYQASGDDGGYTWLIRAA